MRFGPTSTPISIARTAPWPLAAATGISMSVAGRLLTRSRQRRSVRRYRTGRRPHGRAQHEPRPAAATTPSSRATEPTFGSARCREFLAALLLIAEGCRREGQQPTPTRHRGLGQEPRPGHSRPKRPRQDRQRETQREPVSHDVTSPAKPPDQPGLAQRSIAARPANRARSPSSSSIRSNWLYFATRSERAGAPVLICPTPVATTKSAIRASSVLPERCDTTAR